MVKKFYDNRFSDETLAAFIDGNATSEESLDILQSMATDEELREILRIAGEVDADLGICHDDVEIFDVAALAALCEESNFCCLECEKHTARLLLRPRALFLQWRERRLKPQFL